MFDVFSFRRLLVDRMVVLRGNPKWFITIEPIVIRERDGTLDSREVGNRLIYAIIDQQMDVENVVIPSWISMMIAGLDVITLRDFPQEIGEEILSAILNSHGAPRFNTSVDLEKMGISKNMSLPYAIMKAVRRIHNRAKVKVGRKEIILWNDIDEFRDVVRESIQSEYSERLKDILAKGRDPETGDKLFSLAAGAVIDFFLRDIDIQVDKSRVAIKIDVNNLKSGKLTGFFFRDNVLQDILSEQNLEVVQKLYIEHLKQLNISEYKRFQDIIRNVARNSIEAKDINRFLFILGSDYCDSCLARAGNTECPLYGSCLFTWIIEKLPREKRLEFSDAVRKIV